LKQYKKNHHPLKDYDYWDAVAKAREAYRAKIRLGFDGATQQVSPSELRVILESFLEKVQSGIQRAMQFTDGLHPTYFAYEVQDYEIIQDASGKTMLDDQGRPLIRVKRFKPNVLPLFLEGPVRALKITRSQEAARQLYQRVKSSPLFDAKLGMYKVNASLVRQPHDIGRARSFTPGWLENESVWLHMAYKYMLALLDAGLYDEFYMDFKQALIPFHDPEIYGRSPLENSSFIVSSAHPDETLHGGGFVARLSGSTAEFLSIWYKMMVGKQPFYLKEGQLCLAFKPALPGWLFNDDGQIQFNFIGKCKITYNNPVRMNTYDKSIKQTRIILQTGDETPVELAGDVIEAPYAKMVRDGHIHKIDIYFEQQ
jgi:hypothetical protein